ncbi:type-F conjugative transfer system secretin TraK [Sinimarinibacterium sp. NLF-5-8]|uniref:TraK domain-containing protein n=1 Tax=Sinimarinibacterium sp. NLF-5-8 TaxID=2698684 RepID=UPI00137C322E|nr:type-F conjugative transfer system secretin TraK [Sinimarinibacterium sp. NLF-5-8]QHS09083.1 hypothetical protein GT972_02245 [Sinimarinibacterium sp. NLF-5-8]
MLKIKPLIAALALGMTGQAFAQSTQTIEVPVDVYSVLQFGQPIAKAVFPPNAPLEGKPYFMSDNRVLLLMMQSGADPVQTVIQLEDGSMRVIDLVPKPGASGSIKVPGTEAPIQVPDPVVPRVPAARNPGAGVIPVLSSILRGAQPDGWQEAALTKKQVRSHLLRYDRVQATPLRAWVSGNMQVLEYRVEAVKGQASTLDPSQFYRPGVMAAVLDQSVVDKNRSASLWMVWGGRP